MTVGRLVAAVLCGAGLSALSVAADDSDRPLDVAVPLAREEEPLLPAPEEDYLPLDLPYQEDSGAPAGPAGAATVAPSVDLTVTEPEAPGAFYAVQADIFGLPNGEGMVSASLCTRRNFTKSGCRTERVAARAGQVSVTFGEVAPGAYAVQVHHDQNNNGKMDFTFFGLPKEPYGFSRDAKPMLAPPKFDSASFEVTDGNVSLVINLQNT
jgi:uncharacterized protein (DUF2141 family)